MVEISERYKGENLDTLYLGGGTPSLLSVEELSSILAKFSLSDSAEITLEANPCKLSLAYLKQIRQIGINRLSIGAQVFDDKKLAQIGRLHKADDIAAAVNAAKEAGFKNISIDLIYGLPNQTLEDWQFSLESALKLDVKHISLYGLKIEKGSAFFNNMPENIPDDDLQADMYLLAGDVLRQNGYEKYEISNFAREGYDSRHNLNYWNAASYYGFGCGAHGHETGVRYENETDLEKYIENPLKKLSEKILIEQERLEETIFLGFRKADGVNLKEIKGRFGYDLAREKGAIIVKFLDSGHIVRTAEGYAFSDEGFLLSNYILAQIV